MNFKLRLMFKSYISVYCSLVNVLEVWCWVVICWWEMGEMFVEMCGECEEENYKLVLFIILLF